MLISGIAGWGIPGFYDWTGADQSRPVALMWQVPLTVALVAALFCAALPWLSVSQWSRENQLHERAFRFSITSLLVATAVAAACAFVASIVPVIFAGGCCGLACIAVVHQWWSRKDRRLAIMALIGCMFLPFVWVISNDVLNASVIWKAWALPGMLPTMVFARLAGDSFHNMGWLTFVFTAIEIAVGLWLIRGGSKRTTAYLTLLTVASLLGSLWLNAAVRI